MVIPSYLALEEMKVHLELVLFPFRELIEDPFCHFEFGHKLFIR